MLFLFVQPTNHSANGDVKYRRADGKATVASLRRRRVAAIAQDAIVPLGGPGVTLFGYSALPRARFKALCREQETSQFKRLVDRHQAQYEKKVHAWREMKAAARGTPGIKPDMRKIRLGMLRPEKRKAIAKLADQRKARAMSSCFKGQWQTWQEVRRSMRGHDPWIYVEDMNHSEMHGLGACYGEKTFGDYTTDNLESFLQKGKHPACRMILVADVSNVPRHLQMAAMLLGAKVQEHVAKPLFHYTMLRECCFAFTKPFEGAHRELVKVVRSVQDMSQRQGYKPLVAKTKIMGLGKLKRALAAGADASSHHILYADYEEREMAELSMAEKTAARTFPEFVQLSRRMDSEHLRLQFPMRGR